MSAPTPPFSFADVPRSAILEAVAAGNPEQLEAALAMGTYDLSPRNGQTALGSLFFGDPHPTHVALSPRPPGWLACLQILMAHGSEVGTWLSTGGSPGGSVVGHLIKATGDPHTGAQALAELGLLYQFGADPNTPAAVGLGERQALSMAFWPSTWRWGGNTETYPVARVVSLLLEAGASPLSASFSSLHEDLIQLDFRGLAHPLTLEAAVVSLLQHPVHRVKNEQALAAVDDVFLILVHQRWDRATSVLLANLDEMGLLGQAVGQVQDTFRRQEIPSIFIQKCLLAHGLRPSNRPAVRYRM